MRPTDGESKPLVLPMIDLPAIALALALAGGVYAAGVHPILAARAEERRLALSVASRAQHAEEAREIVSGLEARLGRVRSEVEAAPVTLRPMSAVNERLAGLTALAEASGLSIESMTPGAAERLERFRSVPVKLAGRGTYAACAEFLSAVHAQFQDVAVRAVRMTGNPEEPGTPGAFEFDCAWYAAPDEAPATAGAPAP